MIREGTANIIHTDRPTRFIVSSLFGYFLTDWKRSRRLVVSPREPAVRPDECQDGPATPLQTRRELAPTGAHVKPTFCNAGESARSTFNQDLGVARLCAYALPGSMSWHWTERLLRLRPQTTTSSWLALS